MSAPKLGGTHKKEAVSATIRHFGVNMSWKDFDFLEKLGEGYPLFHAPCCTAHLPRHAPPKHCPHERSHTVASGRSPRHTTVPRGHTSPSSRYLRGTSLSHHLPLLHFLKFVIFFSSSPFAFFPSLSLHFPLPPSLSFFSFLSLSSFSLSLSLSSSIASRFPSHLLVSLHLQISLESEADIESIKKEVEFMRGINSRHIVSYFGSYKTDSELWVRVRPRLTHPAHRSSWSTAGSAASTTR